VAGAGEVRRLSHDLSRHRGEIVDISSTGVSANTTFSVTHHLGYIPDQVEVLVGRNTTTSAYVAVRPSGVAWTASTVSLQCNTTNAALRLRIS
jgi:hypothetical protein